MLLLVTNHKSHNDQTPSQQDQWMEIFHCQYRGLKTLPFFRYAGFIERNITIDNHLTDYWILYTITFHSTSILKKQHFVVGWVFKKQCSVVKWRVFLYSIHYFWNSSEVYSSTLSHCKFFTFLLILVSTWIRQLLKVKNTSDLWMKIPTQTWNNHVLKIHSITFWRVK